MASSPTKYASASREELLARIAELEQRQDANNGIHPTSVQSGLITSSATSAPIDVPVASTSALPVQNGDRPPETTTPAGTKSKLTKSERKAVLKQARANGNASGYSAGLKSGNTETDDSTFFERYGSRKIALRFSYEGWLYGGLALQTDVSSISSTNALPTVEGVLLDALVSARLIRPSEKRDLEKLDFSRCGRTDRGVSAAGQVVSLYVRSQLGEEQGARVQGWKPPARRKEESTAVEAAAATSLEDPQVAAAKAKNKPRGELPYMSLLNRVLPSSIRILGWSPVTPDFDARFSCQHRHYKYFFSSPSQSASMTTPLTSSALDISAMRDAAGRLVGEHDFRNLCKIDATKQITNFYRRVMSATISLVPPDQRTAASGTTSTFAEEQMYVFDLKGSAFLYHQVRHIMAILLLVGSGREDPSVVDALLNTGYSNPHNDEESAEQERRIASKYTDAPVVDCKPSYEMAADLPLVLWDCAYPASSELAWRQDSDTPDARSSKAYQEMLVDHTQLRIKETISAHFLQSYLDTGNACDGKAQDAHVTGGVGKSANTVIQLGAGKTARSSKYTALLQRPRSESAEVVNRKWAEGQGARRAERKARTEAEKGIMEVEE